MIIERKSMLSGKINEMDLNIDLVQLDQYYNQGVLAQNAFPNLTDDEREFVMTGILPDEWEELFGNAG